jgi:hypothetical protein
MPIDEKSNDPNVPAVVGRDTGEGGFGVQGISQSGHGVHGDSTGSRGVFGKSASNDGVHGESDTGNGVFGFGRRGVVGESPTFQGVFGHSTENAGVVGESEKFHAVFGISHDVHNAGVFGTNDRGGFGVIGVSDLGIGVSGKGGSLAGRFEGDVEVTGDIRLTNADCAEDFDIGSDLKAEPGTVMVLGEEGALFPSQRAYDKRVAGVVSGAGYHKPGIVLDKQPSERNRQPIALLGKVYCKVDAQYGAIEVGDMLTTSPVLGCAMKASDPLKAFGSVIGKALRPLKEGRGLIPMLISLQ